MEWRRSRRRSTPSFSVRLLVPPRCSRDIRDHCGSRDIPEHRGISETHDLVQTAASARRRDAELEGAAPFCPPRVHAMTGVAYVDGEYMPIERARIPIIHWGFLRSDAT